jgi:hypothetical protein
MAFRIEYFRAGVKVMAEPCSRNLDEAEFNALEGLGLYEADRASILDMNDEGYTVATVARVVSTPEPRLH